MDLGASSSKVDCATSISSSSTAHRTPGLASLLNEVMFHFLKLLIQLLAATSQLPTLKCHLRLTGVTFLAAFHPLRCFITSFSHVVSSLLRPSISVPVRDACPLLPSVSPPVPCGPAALVHVWHVLCRRPSIEQPSHPSLYERYLCVTSCIVLSVLLCCMIVPP